MNRAAILAATIAAIATVDVTITIDHSGSMNSMMPNPIKGANPGMLTRLNAVKTALKPQITQAIAYDQDGVRACTFNTAIGPVVDLTLENFDKWFGGIKAEAGTYLGPVIETLGEEMLVKLVSSKKLQTLFIYTDGAPGDKKATETALQKIANDPRITADGQIGITFVQIGTQDGVVEWLTELDTTLKANRDIVSCTTINQIGELNHETICGYSLAGSFDPALYQEPVAA